MRDISIRFCMQLWFILRMNMVICWTWMLQMISYIGRPMVRDDRNGAKDASSLRFVQVQLINCVRQANSKEYFRCCIINNVIRNKNVHNDTKNLQKYNFRSKLTSIQSPFFFSCKLFSANTQIDSYEIMYKLFC